MVISYMVKKGKFNFYKGGFSIERKIYAFYAGQIWLG